MVSASRARPWTRVLRPSGGGRRRAGRREFWPETTRRAKGRRPRRICSIRVSAARARGRVAGPAPCLAAGPTARLARCIGEMQVVVTDQARPPDARPVVCRGRLDHAGRRMPVEMDAPLPLPALDQDGVAMHGREQRQSLRPVDGHPQSVIVAEVVELGTVFALDGGNPQGLAPAVRLSALSPDAGLRMLIRMALPITRAAERDSCPSPPSRRPAP